MRIERINKGVRIRVIFNRGELREHVRRALIESSSLPEGLEHVSARAIPLFVRSPRHEPKNKGLLLHPMSVTHMELEEVCRRLASEKIEVPLKTEFTIGVGEDGQVSGASFCWWTLEDE
jgi:hypothetical protein